MFLYGLTSMWVSARRHRHLGKPTTRPKGQTMSETPTVADEVVTKAIVRYLDLPFGAGTAAMITLDNGFDHTKPRTRWSRWIEVHRRGT